MHTETSKPHIARLPVVAYTALPITDNRLAVSIPLFHSAIDSGTFTPYNVERLKQIHVKAAIWTAIGLQNNTDLTQHGVGIYFHVEDTIAEMLADFAVPQEVIRTMTLAEPNNTDIRHPHYGKKLMCLDDPDITPDAWLIVDSDAFVCSSEKRLAWYETLVSLDNPATVQASRESATSYQMWVYGVCLAAGLSFDPDSDLFMQEQRAFYKLGFRYFSHPTDEIERTGTENCPYNGVEIGVRKPLQQERRGTETSHYNGVEIGVRKPLQQERRGTETSHYNGVEIGVRKPLQQERRGTETSHYDTLVRYPHPYIASQLIYIPTSHDINGFLKQHYINCYQDEFLLGMWHLKHNDIAQLAETLDGLPLFYKTDDYMGRDKSLDADGYLLHINDSRQEQVDLFYDDFFEALQGESGLETPPTISGLETQPTISGLETQPTISGLETQPTISGLKTQPTISGLETQPTISGLETQPTISGLETQPTISGLETQPTISEKLRQTTSDKEAENGHRYGKLYDFIFDAVYQRQGRKLRVCEVGVSFFGEGSLKAFQELPIVAEVVGIDVLDYEGHLASHATFHKVDDAYTHKTIHMLKQQHELFDIIIDDGSHDPVHQAFFIKFYYDLLADGGCLICEDVYDAEFFKRMCDEEGCYGFDGWANLGAGYQMTDVHNERILIRDKPLPSVGRGLCAPPLLNQSEQAGTETRHYNTVGVGNPSNKRGGNPSNNTGGKRESGNHANNMGETERAGTETRHYNTVGVGNPSNKRGGNHAYDMGGKSEGGNHANERGGKSEGGNLAYDTGGSPANNFHLLGIAYGPTHKDFSACAFVQKTRKGSNMLHKLDHQVYHYGHERSEIDCTEHISVIDDFVLQKTYGTSDYNGAPNGYSVEDLAFTTFDINTERALRKRIEPGDFVLTSFPHKNIAERLADLPVHVVEWGIGYPQTYADYRVYESNGWMHFHRGMEHANGTRSYNEPDWCSAVIPNYFDPDEFEFCDQKEDYMLFIGRVDRCKGIEIALELAKRTGIPLYIAGQNFLGDELYHEMPCNVEYLGVVGSDERKQLMSKAMAVVCPSMYLEPFLGVHIEAGFCGTPVITTNWGAPVEYCQHGVTGFRCQTGAQFVHAVERIGEIHPEKCRIWAYNNFSMDRVGIIYHEYFEGLYRNINGFFW